ncbi:MAG TPA: DUF1292 domain-containing protein [Eubacteriaceae bacterium]|nr:DUF1292 domain-containing protein [Eubacteriaceae bacterium]
MSEEQEQIELIDENGEKVTLKVIMTFENEGKEYAILSEPDEEAQDFYAFRIDEDEQGEILVPVEEDAEIEMVQQVFEQLAEESE